MGYSKLNDKQREAVEQIEGPLLVLAGAGSGKTSTMTHRIAHMVELGIPAWKILAVTFTNKAAKEMRERVESMTESASDMWIMTFHAMCLRILYTHPEEAGYKPNFVIYDTSDQKTLVKNILKAKGISDKEYKPQEIISAISKAKEKALDPEDYREQMGFSPREKAVYAVYKSYVRQLRENNAMDFDDLLLNTYRLFENNKDVLEKYQDRFNYIMVDEYQDTNFIQYRLMCMLAEKHHNICVVGDDDQCIYQWRGADIRNILDFEKDFPDAKVIKLEQNYRSKANILSAAHSVIKNNRSRKPKELWTTADKGEKIHYYRAINDREEGGYIARTINLLKMQGREYSDFAILYRTNAQSRVFEQTLSQEGIPYQILSGMRYYDRKEIKDAMAYMRLIVNPSDDLSLRRIINEPKRGVGPKTVDKLQVMADIRGQSLFEALCDEDRELLETLPGKAYEKVGSMIDCLTSVRNNMDKTSIEDIFSNIIVGTGYIKALEEANNLESESRIENLKEFMSVISEYERNEDNPTMEGFMSELTLAADVDKFEDDEKMVTLMTMHSAKGLEFPVVFMPGMEDGIFPGNRSMDDSAKMEEERRLCYVGITRAKEVLYMSSAEERMRFGRFEHNRESQFMRELDPHLLDGAVYKKKNPVGVSTGSKDGYSKNAYNPFAAYKQSRQGTGAEKIAGSSDFNTGDRVSHKKFGEGLVIDSNDSIVTVAFDSAGIKKMAKGVAPLTRM